MTDTENVVASLESLRHKRAYRRGQVTKVKTKTNRLLEQDPEDIDLRIVENLLLDLTTHLNMHNAIQTEMVELYNAHPAHAVDEEEECDRIADAHQAVNNLLLDVQQAVPLWGEAAILLKQIERKLDTPHADSPMFRSLVETLHTRFTSLSGAAQRYYRSLPPLKEKCELIERRLDNLILLVEVGYKDTPTPAAPMPTAPSFPSHHHSALHLELPQFDGDPFKWANFATMFKATIASRAKGHTNLEIRGHLIKAVKHPTGQKLLQNLPSEDMDMDSMLALLESKFGAPDVLGPLIILKINGVKHFRLSPSDIDCVHDNYILPFQRFCASAGDSLSTYLAMALTGLMDAECKREWLRHKKPDSKPDMETILKFVRYWQKEFVADDASISPAPTPYLSNTHNQTMPPRPTSSTNFRNKTQSAKNLSNHRRAPPQCHACEDTHQLSKCNTFLAYDVDRRNKLVRDKKLCLNCFSDSHGCKTCPSKFSCRTCNGRHHTTLHRERDTTTPSAAPTTAAVLTTASDVPPSRQVRFLYSAQVVLQNGDRTLRARALLDSGAAIPMITEHLATELKLHRVHDPIPVNGITGTTQCKFVVKSDLLSLDSRYCSKSITFTVIPSLEPLRSPKNQAEILSRPELRHFYLADADLGGKVDLVLGVEQTSDLTTGKPFQIGNLRALPTLLGLCLSGPLESSDLPSVMTVAPPTNLAEDLSTLWQLDQVDETSPLTDAETSAVTQFHKSCKRVEGRYSVSLPRVAVQSSLGNSRKQAMSRLYANERSLSQKEKLTDFHDVLDEYFVLDHAEHVPDAELNNPNTYYLPVHAVIKDSSTTTKVRAVFDASARSTSGVSLNDQLLPGPSLYPPLPDVLTRFRCHNVAVTADISKMFREILLNPEERDWHRFLVRTKDGLIKDSRMKRLTFGVKSSPFLASQVLREHATAHLSSHPIAANTVLNDFYVDDVLTGAPNVEDALHLQQQLYQLLYSAGMNLRKWRTNSDQLRSLIPSHLLESDTSLKDIQPSPSAQKALGVHWDTQADTFHVAVPDVHPASQPATKRMIAAGTAGVFDVLGLFSPVIICARILFQDTWRLGLTWDEEVPEAVNTKWQQWLSDLPVIHNHPVPRKLFPHSSAPDIKLHGFCDASSVAYGAAIYARTISPDQSVHTVLVIAKARVLPTKPMTIPKAELSGAHLLAKLLCHTLHLFDLNSEDAVAWTDSQIVLHWLPKHPSQLNRFVANRVSAINELLPATPWRHVPSLQNPADLASRGVRAHELSTSSLWWNGPSWLRLCPEHWPPPFQTKPSIPIYSVSLKPCLTLPPERLSFLKTLWSLSSNFFYLVRVVCFLYRFFNNCKLSRERRVSRPITFDEVVACKHKLYQLSQEETVPELFPVARKKSHLPNHHRMCKFHLCLSAHGHLQVQSRVRNPDSPRTPLLLTVLSLKSDLTKLLLSSLHKVYGHAGVSAMASILSSSFYISGLRNHLKFVSRSCTVCQRAYAHPISHSMGMLPSSRTTPAPPFDKTGVDFAGPFMLKKGHTRKPVLVKTYAVVFVCLTTKAVHLDICSSLSTEETSWPSSKDSLPGVAVHPTSCLTMARIS